MNCAKILPQQPKLEDWDDHSTLLDGHYPNEKTKKNFNAILIDKRKWLRSEVYWGNGVDLEAQKSPSKFKNPIYE